MEKFNNEVGYEGSAYARKAQLESEENRIILKNLKQTHLRVEDPCRNKDIMLMSLNSIIEFIFEGFKRDV
jgi:hypothetical protein